MYTAAAGGCCDFLVTEDSKVLLSFSLSLAGTRSAPHTSLALGLDSPASACYCHRDEAADRRQESIEAKRTALATQLADGGTV